MGIRVQLPSELGGECGGLLFESQIFKAAGDRFWDTLTQARELRYSNPAFFWERTGRLCPSALNERAVAMIDDAWRSSKDSMTSCAQSLVSDAMASWRSVVIGDEEGFFKAEEEVASLVERAAVFLPKVDRLFRSSRGNGNKATEMSTDVLDACCLVVCGTPLSSKGAYVRPELVRQVSEAFQLVECSHAVEIDAANLIERLSQNPATALLATTTVRREIAELKHRVSRSLRRGVASPWTQLFSPSKIKCHPPHLWN